MNFKGIRRTVHELLYFKKIIKQYGAQLLPGNYYLFPSMRAIAADNPDSMECAKLYFEKKKAASKATALITKLNQSSFYHNRQKSDLEKYEAVYVANNYDKVREIKLFSFQRKQILTICTSAQICRQQLEEFQQLHSYFSMPGLAAQPDNERGYTISMVSLLPRPEEKQALENIATCCSAYHVAHPAQTNSLPVCHILDFSYDDPTLVQPLADLANRINNTAKQLQIPLCLQHGDLSRDNLIYGNCDEKDDFWWIDWEHARPRLFFYDYFFYILNTAVYFKDTTALQNYLQGDYDRHLSEFFEKFSMDYDPHLRKDYFLIFAVVFLKERVGDRGNARAMKMYCDFINQTLGEQV